MKIYSITNGESTSYRSVRKTGRGEVSLRLLLEIATPHIAKLKNSHKSSKFPNLFKSVNRASNFAAKELNALWNV